jgi:hypothetical protein
MFGTYVRKGEIPLYSSFEYNRDENLEHAPPNWVRRRGGLPRLTSGDRILSTFGH